MYKVKKKLSADKMYYVDIECEELFTVSINVRNHSDAFIGRDKDGNIYYVDEEEAHVGNAYFMAREFYAIYEEELLEFIDKAYANGHISRSQRDRYRCGDFTKQDDKPVVFASDIWYCTECGFKNTKGKFCGECGKPKLKLDKKQFNNDSKTKNETLLVYAERQSVSMGDDCHAPHRCPLEYTKDTMLSEFMSSVADYVPSMHNFTWEVRCDLQTLAYLIFDDKGNWTYELAVVDAELYMLLDKYLDKEIYAEKEIFCRKYRMHGNMLLLKLNDNILFVYNNARYQLTSNSYEPCLYIKNNGLAVCVLHNSFDAYDLPDKFERDEKLLGCDGKLYDEEAFLNVLAAAIDSGRKEMDFAYASKLVINQF